MSFPPLPFFSEDVGSGAYKTGEKRRVLDLILSTILAGGAGGGLSTYTALTPGADWSGQTGIQEPAAVLFGQVVFLQGVIEVTATGGTTNGSLMFNLPPSPSLRPGAPLKLESAGWEYHVATNGDVTFEGRDGFDGFIILNGIWRLGGAAA